MADLQTNPHKGRTGLARVAHAAAHSMDGLSAAYRFESAFRQEVWLAVLGLPVAYWLGQSWLERSVLLGAICLVLVVELLNSAIEAAIDRIGYEHHELSKRAKDFGSAAVMLALLFCMGLMASAALRNWLQ